MVNSSFIFFLEKKTYLINWLTISSFPPWSLFNTPTNPFLNLIKLNHIWILITHISGCNFVCCKINRKNVMTIQNLVYSDDIEVRFVCLYVHHTKARYRSRVVRVLTPRGRDIGGALSCPPQIIQSVVRLISWFAFIDQSCFAFVAYCNY